MPEYHPGTDIEIPSHIPASPFRNKIKNTKRYTKENDKTIQDVVKAAHQGDFELLEELLSKGDATNLFNGDLNVHVNNKTALHMAAIAGQAECVDLLLEAGADPHIRECMPYGKDPEDGRTAKELADTHGWGDCVDALEKAEKKEKYGWYVPEGPTNNHKVYGCYEHGKKPQKGWYMSRPGAAKRNGLDPAKYGDVESDDGADEDMEGPGEPPMPVGLLFPGQGSQYVGMMKDLATRPEVKDMIKKADKILGWKVMDVMQSGPESKLEETKNCQPCVFIADLAGYEKLKDDQEEKARRAKGVAGLSLGEYAALVVAGVFTFEDGLELVKVRGEEMQKATKNGGKQAMISVAGIEKGKLAELCNEARKHEGGKAVCQIANELFPKGFSCAGTEPAILHLKDLAEKAGALQAKVLKASGAFHTSLMEPAAEALGKKLDEVLPRMKPPKMNVYLNSTGLPIKPGQNPKVIVDALKKQLTSSVLWESSIRNMLKDDITEFYEVGPMKQLKAMMKRIDAKSWGTTYNIDV